MSNPRSGSSENVNIYSNHVPVLVVHKVGEKKLNVLTLDMGSFGKSLTGAADSKLDSGAKSKIVNDLNIAISKQKLDMILLQNAACIVTELKEKFKNKWSVIQNKNDIKQGLIIIFNKSDLDFKLEGSMDNNDNKDLILKDCTQTVRFRNKSQLLIVHNVCWPHEENSVQLVAEKYLPSLLVGPAIVAGNFGDRVVVSSEERWVNNIGCFVASKEKHIQQLEGQLIDVDSGDVIQVTSSIKEDAADEQLKKQSFFVSVTAENKKALADEKAVGILKENGIVLRETTSAFNERGLALIFDPMKKEAVELHTLFAKFFDQDKNKKDDKNLSILYCSKNMLETVVETIHQRKENLLLLDHAQREIREYKAILENELSGLKDTDKTEDKKLRNDKLDLLVNLNTSVKKWINDGEASMDRPFYDFKKEYMGKNKAIFEEGGGFLMWKNNNPMNNLFEKILIPLDAKLLRISIMLKVPFLGVEFEPASPC